MRTKHLIAFTTVTVVTAVAASVSILVSIGTAVAGQDTLSSARSGTANFHQLDAAVGDGYGQLTDAAGVACIDKAGEGAMGVHYVKGALVGDPSVDAATPEALVYEPQENGRMRLVAVEYVVLKSAWEEAGNLAVPSLFGQDFLLVEAGNRYGLPAFYELHAWIWKHNPSGMFGDWNPRVSCAAA